MPENGSDGGCPEKTTAARKVFLGSAISGQSREAGCIAAGPTFCHCFKCGDVNQDGKVDIADLVKLQRIVAGTDCTPGFYCSPIANDVNGDGKLDVADLIRLRGYLLGQAPLACRPL